MRHRESKSSNIRSRALSRKSSREEVGPEKRPRVDARGIRAAKISFLARGRGQVPMLRLTGNWLANAGFDIGQLIEIKVQCGRLTIQQIETRGTEEPTSISG